MLIEKLPWRRSTLDELDAPPPAPSYDQAALRSVHRAGLVAAIGVFVAACGFGLQSFLGGLGAASANVGPDRPPVVQPVPVASTFRLPPPPDASPGPDQQAAFLTSIQASGTGGWSNRYDLVRYGLQACRTLSSGSTDADVVAVLVAAGEDRDQAVAVVAAAPDTLCPAGDPQLTLVAK